MSTAGVDVVIPTLGRPSLALLLEALAEAEGPRPGVVVVVDDRRQADEPLASVPGVTVVPGPVAGPAAARNAGWRATSAPWVAFLDDDVVPAPDWLQRLGEDLADLPADVAGSQGVVSVPRPAGRAPTDWQRNVAGLENARWATADMAYRRTALAAVGGFDERFPRAYREDSDLALRLGRAGYRLALGRREVLHPVRPAGPLVSLSLQRGNRDDALMRALHGRRWREEAGCPPGRLGRHAAVVAAAVAGLVGLAAGRRALARAAALAWATGTAELAWARIAPGPRTAGEVARMAGTSVALPALAVAHRAAGTVRAGRLARRPIPRPRPRAVLLDRDGTLVVNVPYNGDPERVVPVDGAREALERLRDAGIRLALISNQSAIASGHLSVEQVEAVNRRLEAALGPLGPWFVCPHAPDDGCACRKPAPGLVVRAAAALGVRPTECALIGDIGSDVQAALGAGARPVLVPNVATRPGEIAAAPEVAPTLEAAVSLLLGAP